MKEEKPLYYNETATMGKPEEERLQTTAAELTTKKSRCYTIKITTAATDVISRY